MSGTDLPIDPRGVLLIRPDPSGDPNSLSMEQLTVLTVEDHSRYAQAYRQILDIVVGGVFTYFLVSARDLRARIAAANQAFLGRRFAPQTQPEEALQWVTGLRAAVLSLAASLTYHQEQIYQLASELHGGDQAIIAAIKAVFSDLYDTNRGYRLLYSLRNLMTHETMEVVALDARALLVQGRVECRFRLRVDRGVATRSDKVKAAVKNELQEMLHDPDIIELLGEVGSPLSDANRLLYEILYPDLRLTCQTIMEFESLFQGRAGTRALVTDWNPETPGERPSWTAWAPQVLDFAARNLDS